MANTKITSRVIAANAILTANITDANVTTAKIADSNVTVGKMAANSVDSDQYVDGSIDTAHIADSQITVGKMAANSVDSDQYVDGSIDLAHMSVNSIDSDQYVDGSIDLAHMSDNSIDSDQYVDGSIDTAHIADSQITVGKMAANSVDSAQYVDGSIDTAHYADNSITGAELADNIDIAGTLDVTGAATLDSTLGVAGLTTLSGDLTLTSATANKPVLTLTNTNADSQGADLVFRKDSSSPADNDELFRIYGYGDDDAGNATEGFLMLATMTDVSNGSEDTKVRMMTYGAGSQRDTLTLAGTNVGIGTTAPSGLLNISGSTNSETFEHLTLKSTVDANPSRINMFFESGNGKLAKIEGRQIAGSSNAYGELNFFTSNNGTLSEKMSVKYDGKVGIGTTTPNRTLSASTGLAKTSTTTAYPFAIQSNEASGQAMLSIHAVGGASAAVRKWYVQTEESGVANAGQIHLNPHGGTVHSPQGIIFGTETTAAHTLNDYEEGSWTPTSGVSLTTSTACRYVKVGNHVTITFDVEFASSSSGSGSSISNLPFTLTTYNGGYTNWQNTGSGVMIHCGGTTGSLYNSVTGAVFTYAAVSGKRVIGTIVGIAA